LHQKAVADVGSLREIVDDDRTVVEQRETELVAAIERLVEQAAIAVGRNGRTQDLDIGRSLDQTLRVARRTIEIDDDRIARITRGHRDGSARDDPVVGADRAEASPLERRRFYAHNFEFDNFGRGRTGETDDARDQNDGGQQMPHGASPRCLRRALAAGRALENIVRSVRREG